jgi:HlyD family secretion protein
MPAQNGGRAMFWVPLVFVALGLGCAIGGAGVYYYLHDNETTTTGNAPEPSTELKVVALGRIEPRDGVLSLGVASPDRIREIKVKEDDPVKAGQPLVILEGQKMRELDTEMAKIQFAQAKTRLKAIEENGEAQIQVARLRRDRIKQLEPIEINMLRSKIKLLEKQKQNAQRNYERYVAAGDIVAGMDKEKQELAQQQIEADIASTTDQLEKLRQSSKLDRDLAEAQVRAVQAELKQTQSTLSLEVLGKQVQQAEERGKETEILAPSEGTILRLFAHKGELVQVKPILQMANVDNMIVLAEVDEKDVQRVRIDQPARIVSQAFDKTCSQVSGRVVWIANNVGKAEMVPLDPRAAVSDRVVQVKIALNQPKCVAKLIGLQVQVEIETKESTAGAR